MALLASWLPVVHHEAMSHLCVCPCCLPCPYLPLHFPSPSHPCILLQVVRTALVDAASVSSLITTSEAVVVEMPEDKKMPSIPPPDMY